MIFRHPSFDPDSEKPKVKCPTNSSKTKQNFKEECDINTIVRKFIRTGTIDQSALNTRQAAFMDATAMPGYQECLERINEATAAFAKLPAATRARFDNDPAQLVEFIDDPNNQIEAENLGLLPKPEQAPNPTPEAPRPETV